TLGERIGEGVVLLARALDPEHVVEEQLVLVRRREPFQLKVRAMQQRPSQRPDFRTDEEPRRCLGGPIGAAAFLFENRHRYIPSALPPGPGVAAGPGSNRWLHVVGALRRPGVGLRAVHGSGRLVACAMSAIQRSISTLLPF